MKGGSATPQAFEARRRAEGKRYDLTTEGKAGSSLTSTIGGVVGRGGLLPQKEASGEDIRGEYRY